MKQLEGFNKHRSAVNSHLGSISKKPYQKNLDPDFRKLLTHICNQIHIDIKLPILKTKVCRSIVRSWILSEFSTADIEYNIRIECANWYARNSERKEKKGELRNIADPIHKEIISHLPAKKFYSSPEWRSIRYRVLKSSSASCCCCGSKASPDVQLHVDHIKPRSIYPELALEFDNLQVLCCDCNLGKSNKHDDDWR